MKKILIMFLTLLTSQIFATIQESEIIIYNNEIHSLPVGFDNKAPLEYFFSSHNIRSPFRMISTANYRGYTGTWIIQDSKLYLNKISIKQYYYPEKKVIDIPLNYIFHHYVKDNMVFAQWFTDIILVENKAMEELIIIDIKDGLVINNKKITYKEFNNYSKENRQKNKINDSEVNMSLSEFFNRRSSIIPDEEILKLSKEDLERTYMKLDKIYTKFDDYINKKKEDRKNKENKIAESIYKSLSGYTEVINNFYIESTKISDNSHRYKEYVSQPTNLLLELKSKNNNNYLIKWEIPVNNMNAEYTWYDLQNTYLNTLNAINKINWINEWIESTHSSSITIHIYGDSPYREKNIEMFVYQPWNEAQLKGKPLYEIQLKGKGFRSTLFIGIEEDRTLITSCTSKEKKFDPEKFIDLQYIESIIKEDKIHWLDIFDFNYHPQSGQYLVIAKNGKISISNSWITNKKSIWD